MTSQVAVANPQSMDHSDRIEGREGESVSVLKLNPGISGCWTLTVTQAIGFTDLKVCGIRLEAHCQLSTWLV